MALNLVNLDDRTRSFMLQELEFDVKQGALYLSPRLTVQGRAEYPQLLREAISRGSDVSLAEMLRTRGMLVATEQRRKPRGGYTTAQIPVTAPETLAEGEFNRFYARGLCLRAIEDGISELVIYRAKDVVNPRPESQTLIGQRINAQALLADLRTSQGVEPALHLPPGPNSGLSVRLP